VLGISLNGRDALSGRPAAAPQPTAKNAHTALSLVDTAIDKRFTMPFRKTYDYSGEFIDSTHRMLMDAPLRDGMIDVGIEGWLLPANAMKLYELAYFTGGDMLELGTYKGLSTSILAHAAHNQGRRLSIVTVELHAHVSAEAEAGMKARRQPGRENVQFFVFEAEQFVSNLANVHRAFEFVFVDHSHRYEHVLATARKLHLVTRPGGFCLFQDFNEPRNPDANNRDYGVYQGVTDGLSKADFEFYGIFGSSGLFRRT
jgi:predicted O-methyltransferase YrrM